jgi:hypothetical protein
MPNRCPRQEEDILEPSVNARSEILDKRIGLAMWAIAEANRTAGVPQNAASEGVPPNAAFNNENERLISHLDDALVGRGDAIYYQGDASAVRDS